MFESLYNIVLLVALCAAAGIALRRWEGSGYAGARAGAIFGLIAAAALLAPYGDLAGLDGRSVPLALCALHFGFRAAGVAVLVACAAAWLDGAAGLASIFLPAAIGLAGRRFGWTPDAALDPAHTGAMGLAAHLPLFGLAVITGQWGAQSLWQAGLFSLLVYPAAMALSAAALRDQRRLAERARRFHHVFDQEFQFMAVLSPEGRLLEVNDLALRVTGTERDAVVGKLFWETPWWRDLPEMRENWPRRLEEAASAAGPIRSRDTYQDKAGNTRLAEATVSAVKDAAGDVDCFIIQASDVTERIKAQSALGQSEVLRRTAGRVARVGGWIMELPERRVTCSEEVYAIREWPPDYQPTVAATLASCPPEWRAPFSEAIEACIAEGVPYDLEIELFTGSGRRIWVRTIGEAVRDGEGRIIRLQGAMQDITELKQSQAAVARMAARVTETLESITDAFCTLDEEWRFTYLNREAARLARRPKRELIGRVYYEAFPAIRDTHMDENLRRAAREGRALSFETYYAPMKMWLEMRAYPLEGGIAVHYRDVTDRVAADRKLREATSRLQGILEYSPLFIAVLDLEGRYLIANHAHDHLAGQAMEGRTLWELLPEDKAADYHRAINEVAATRQARTIEDRIEIGGEPHFLSTVLFPLMDENGSVATVGGIAMETTESRRVEAERERLRHQLHESQKMEAVGRLAGGVAHDFNNMLGVIAGYTELVLSNLDTADPHRKDLLEIRQAAARSTALTRQLLAFARKQTIAPQVLDLNGVVERMLKMLGRLIGENVQLRWIPGSNLRPVCVDPTQIDQILANLAVNARDAISGQGALTIETGATELDEAYCEVHPGFVPGRFIVLAVSDDGCGMDRETLDQVFEPFFTTKGPGLGTGLGLATVYGIVKQSSGFINVYSEPGQGTTFRIYFPESAVEPDGTAAPERTAAPGGSETILLVEDEPALLALGTRQLALLGYNVLSAATPDEALRIAREHDGEIGLLLTDVIMPGMDGKELWRNVDALRPGVKTLFMSGYTADTIAHRGVLDTGVNFLQKPFNTRSIAAKIREVIDGRPIG
ncbi:MAG: PAS domain-containing protein [Candidatus Hydrogenedentes bacterium]|nr:PAS domain-containing protein [Candidatus Hydrogenedentota bacterium]